MRDGNIVPIGERLQPPPGNVEVEMALLGALLVDNRRYDEVSEIVAAEHFLLLHHGAIFRGIAMLIERGERASASNLSHVVAGDAAMATQPQYLAQLAATGAYASEAVSYARTIRQLWIAREAIGIAEKAIADMRDGSAEAPVEDRIADITGALDALATKQDRTGWIFMDRAVQNAVQSSQDAAQRGDGLVGRSTGLSALDDATGGLEPGTIVIVGARPGMGKTSLADFLADTIARDELAAKTMAPVACFSLEMRAAQLGQRWLSRKAALDLGNVRRGKVSDGDMERLALLSRSVGKLPLAIDETPALTLQALRSRSRLLHRQGGGLSVIIVDHIGLMRPTNPRMQRHEHLGEITSGLKALGKELHCPVIALCQLSRGVEGRDDKRPGLSDLRESGRIEEDADGVWLLYREAYYLERSPKKFGDKGFDEWDQAMHRAQNLCEVIIAKQRQGPACTVTLRFDPKTTAFSDRIADTRQGGMDYANEGGWR